MNLMAKPRPTAYILKSGKEADFFRTAITEEKIRDIHAKSQKFEKACLQTKKEK